MTAKEKTELIKTFNNAFNALFETVVDDDGKQPEQNIGDVSVELLTIKEALKVVSGLSEHAIRKLVTENKINSFRPSGNQRGKILIEKQSLINFVKGNSLK